MSSSDQKESDDLVINLNDSNFHQTLKDSDQPVFVDFWAPWCGPCMAITPTINQVAQDFKGKVVVAKVNVDENNETAAKYNVRSIPFLAMFKNGEVAESLVGSASKSAITDLISRHL